MLQHTAATALATPAAACLAAPLIAGECGIMCQKMKMQRRRPADRATYIQHTPHILASDVSASAYSHMQTCISMHICALCIICICCELVSSTQCSMLHAAALALLFWLLHSYSRICHKLFVAVVSVCNTLCQCGKPDLYFVGQKCLWNSNGCRKTCNSMT